MTGSKLDAQRNRHFLYAWVLVCLFGKLCLLRSPLPSWCPVGCLVLNWLLSRYGGVTVPKHGFENHDWRSEWGDVAAPGKISATGQIPQRPGQSYRWDLGCLQLGFLGAWTSFTLVCPSYECDWWVRGSRAPGLPACCLLKVIAGIFGICQGCTWGHSGSVTQDGSLLFGSAV